MSNCGCVHCNCDDKNSEKTPEDPSDAKALAGKKIAELEKEIENLGYKIEKTPEGDIKILEKA
jgi:hypothetical protein